jgi:hypothetical protein
VVSVVDGVPAPPVWEAEVTGCAFGSAAPVSTGCGPVATSRPTAAPPPASTMAVAVAARRILLDGGFRWVPPGRPRPEPGRPGPTGLMPFRYSHVSVSSSFRYGLVLGPKSFRYVRVSVFIWGTIRLLRGEVLVEVDVSPYSVTQGDGDNPQ